MAINITVQFGANVIQKVPVVFTDVTSSGKGVTRKTAKAGQLVFATATASKQYKVHFERTIIVDTATYTIATSGTKLTLVGSEDIHCGPASSDIDLIVKYERAGCLIHGSVERELYKSSKFGPLASVGIKIIDSSATPPTILDQITSGADGGFCSYAAPAKSGLLTLQFEAEVTDGNDKLRLTDNRFDIYVHNDQINELKAPVRYSLAMGVISGQVTDGTRGLKGAIVELFYPETGVKKTAKTNRLGGYEFSDITPGSVELRFANSTTDAEGTVWNLQSTQPARQPFTVQANQLQQALPVAYAEEAHTIQQLVEINGKPASDVLVDVRTAKSSFALQSQRTGVDGMATFVLPTAGTYEVRVYPDPSAFGDPQVNVVEVHSNCLAPKINLPRQINEGRDPEPYGNAGSRAGIDLQAYPVLTEQVPAGVMPTTTRPGPGGMVGGTSDLAQTADRAIREVLSWRTKSDDAKNFMAALGQAFDLKEVEGHTEWTWTPRSYTVQTDLGAVTGAQASIFTRAKVALDQSMPLLDGLYPLVPSVEAEDLATVQSVVRTQFTTLVNEFGTVGGPRVSRIDELFELLLGYENPDPLPTRPEDIVKGSLGLVRKRYGLERKFVISVDDEQNLTNYLIMVDYVIGLNHSWRNDKNYFVRNGAIPGTNGFSPFFGTQLVLLSRALDVVTQGVQDAYFAMDSVFMGDAERQVAQLTFANLAPQISIPNPKGGTELLTFPDHVSGLFVAELMDWVIRAADEMRGLLQDAGKDGLESVQRVANRLRKFVHGSIVPPQNPRGLPPGYSTPRVQRALRLLADGLDETHKLAVQLCPSDLPVDRSESELRRFIHDEIKRASKIEAPNGLR